MSTNHDRPFPAFLSEWQEANGGNFTPLDYIGQSESIEHTIAAQWIFCPELIEHKGGVFFSKFPTSASEARRANIDSWIEALDGDTSRVEQNANLITLYDVFSDCDDTEPYEDDLSQLAQSIAQCWRGLLALQFPNRDFTVEVYDDEHSYGPQITFFTTRPQAPAIVVHDVPPRMLGTLEGVDIAIHLDLPNSLRNAFLNLTTKPETIVEVDARTLTDVSTLLRQIEGDPADEHTRTDPEVLILHNTEQLQVRNPTGTQELLAGLPSALARARTNDKTRHVALADLTSTTTTEFINWLRQAPTTPPDPVTVFSYPPAL